MRMLMMNGIEGRIELFPVPAAVGVTSAFSAMVRMMGWRGVRGRRAGEAGHPVRMFGNF